MHKYEIIPNKVFVNVYDKTFKNSSHLYKSSDTVSMSEVQKNYNAILKHQDSSSMCLLRQNSEADVHVMDKIWTFADNPVADSIITCIPNVIIGIQTADCVPIMLTNRDGKIIAAIHCGWKGALMGVIQNTCDMLRNNFNNNRGLSFTSVICPSIAQVNYEFGSELRDKFIKNDHHTKEFFLQTDKFLFDLRGYVKHLLIRNGIDISISLDDDTYAMSEQYMSHRHNTHLGIIDERRMLSTILMRSLHI